MMKYDKDPPQRNSSVREHPVQSMMTAKMKRLTIDVSGDLHSAIKVECARKGIKMADAIRGLLENEFGGDVS